LPLVAKRWAFLLAFLVLVPGCRMGYLLHLAAGQARLLSGSIPVEEALKEASLSGEQRERLLLVRRIKEFGEKELGLRETENYESVYLKSRFRPIYTVSASPKDRLIRRTWWFPVVGHMPYLGFFDQASAQREVDKLLQEDLDVTMGMADAYSTLGWFKDPLTLNLLEGTTFDLVETILHEMTHTTLYVKGQGEFNEGLAVLVGKAGALLFLERTRGPEDPLSLEARGSIADERVFSLFIHSLMRTLEAVYGADSSYQEKLREREKVFRDCLEEHERLKGVFRTGHFSHFGARGLNNAYLMSVALYHRNFHLFERYLGRNGNSIRTMLSSLRDLSSGGGDLLEMIERET